MTRETTRRAAVAAAIAGRLTPEHTRRATWFERHTVRKISQDRLLRWHSWLEFFGKVTTVVYCWFIATVVLGADWKHTVEDAVNGGKPVKGALILVLVVPTLVFVAARSLVGFLRWKVQRELWRRDVERLSAREPSTV